MSENWMYVPKFWGFAYIHVPEFRCDSAYVMCPFWHSPKHCIVVFVIWL